MFQGLSSGTLIKGLFLLMWVVCGFAVLNLRQIRRLRKVAARFDGSLAFYSLFLPAVAGRYEHLEFSIVAGPRFLEVPGTLKIRLLLRPLITARIFRRSFLGKAAAKIRLLAEVKTGDSIFDAEFAVFARDADTVGNYLQQTAVREALLTLFEYGFWMLVVDGRGAWAEKLAYDRKLDLEPARVSAALRLLKLVAIGT